MPVWLLYLGIGTIGGICAGLFGIGGGIVIVPALVYWAGFTQQKATGTSLAVLLPPVGLAATVEYYRNGNVDLRAALLIALAMIFATWGGALLAHQLKGPYLRLLFGLFLTSLGLYLVFGAGRRLGWF